MTVATLCRAPDRSGSVRADTAPSGGPVVRSCQRPTTLRARPAGRAAGTVTAREPLAVLGGDRRWLRVRTAARRTGWIDADVAC